jgi:hypothetical protein
MEGSVESNRGFEAVVSILSSLNVIATSLLFSFLSRLIREGGWTDLHFTQVAIDIVIITDIGWVAAVAWCVYRKKYGAIPHFSICVATFFQTLLIWNVGMEVGTYVLKLH